MARKRFLIAAGAALLLASQARAAPTNGVVTGLSVVWNASNKIHVEIGEGYAAGNPYGGNVTFFWFANLQNGQAVTANTAYYVYACYDASAMPAGFTNPPVVSDIPPSNGGIGAGIQAGNGDACSALFLGSIVTDSTANLVPFVRSGEEVTLALLNNGCVSGGWYYGGGAVNVNLPSFTNTSCWLVAFDSTAGVGNTCNGYDNLGNPLFLPYPASASAMLIDWTLANDDTTPKHHIDVLPQSPLPAPPPLSYLENTQLDLFLPAAIIVGGSTVPYPRYYSHTRVNPTVVAGTNVGNTPPAPATSQEFNVCIDQFVNNVTSVSGYAIYRGYVESIGHLTQGAGT
jgi:hypothetical protein